MDSMVENSTINVKPSLSFLLQVEANKITIINVHIQQKKQFNECSVIL